MTEAHKFSISDFKDVFEDAKAQTGRAEVTHHLPNEGTYSASLEETDDGAQIILSHITYDKNHKPNPPESFFRVVEKGSEIAFESLPVIIENIPQPARGAELFLLRSMLSVSQMWLQQSRREGLVE